MKAEKNSMSKLKYLKKKIDFFIKDYEEKRWWIRRRAEGMRSAAIILAALTTVLVGLREFDIMGPYSQQLGIAALVASALTSMFTAWEAFANYGWRWVHYRVTLMKFRLLKDRLEYDTADGEELDDNSLDKLFDDVNSVIAEANEQWHEHRAKTISQS